MSFRWIKNVQRPTPVVGESISARVNTLPLSWINLMAGSVGRYSHPIANSAHAAHRRLSEQAKLVDVPEAAAPQTEETIRDDTSLRPFGGAALHATLELSDPSQPHESGIST